MIGRHRKPDDRQVGAMRSGASASWLVVEGQKLKIENTAAETPAPRRSVA